jgi:hypothetical protein
MSALAASLVTAVVTAALAIVGTYYTTRRNLEVTFDTSLRELRITAYKDLWKKLDVLAKYGRPAPLTDKEAHDLAETLRIWYFETGGIFLSTRTRRDYFALLDGLENVGGGSETDDEFLRVLGSRLRSGMTADVGTRRTFPLGATERSRGVPRRREFAELGGTRRLAVTPGPRRFLLGRRPPELEAEGPWPGQRWDPDRSAFSARLTCGDAPDARVFLLEDTHVVEGPEGWRRGSKEQRPESVLWVEKEPEPGEGSRKPPEG